MTDIFISINLTYTARRLLPPVYIEFQPGSTLLLLFNIISIVPNCFICRGWHKVLFVKIASFTSHALELVSATPANEWRWGSGVQPLGARRLTHKWVTKGYLGVRHTRQIRWGSYGEAPSFIETAETSSQNHLQEVHWPSRPKTGFLGAALVQFK